MRNIFKHELFKKIYNSIRDFCEMELHPLDWTEQNQICTRGLNVNPQPQTKFRPFPKEINFESG
jgi:hypothetical protein